MGLTNDNKYLHNVVTFKAVSNKLLRPKLSFSTEYFNLAALSRARSYLLGFLRLTERKDGSLTPAMATVQAKPRRGPIQPTALPGKG